MMVARFLASRTFYRDRTRTLLLIASITVILILSIAVSTIRVNLARLEVINAQIDIGSWHMSYIADQPDVTDRLNQHNAIESASLAYRLEFPTTEGYVFDLTLLESNRFESFTLPIIQGTKPVEAGEVIVPDWVLEKYSIDSLPAVLNIAGNEFTLTGTYWGRARGIRTQTISAYGIIEGNQELVQNNLLSQSPGRALDSYTSENPKFVYIRVADEARNPVSILRSFDGLKPFPVPDNFQRAQNSPAYNLRLIEAEGRQVRFLMQAPSATYRIRDTLILLAFAGVLFAMVFVAMNMTVTNSIRTLGVLSAVGMSPQAISSFILLRAAYCIVAALPLGVILGLSVSRLALWFELGQFAGGIIIPLSDILVYIIITALAVVGGATYPAVRVSRITPINAINIQPISSEGTLTQWKIPLNTVRSKSSFSIIYGIRAYCKLSMSTIGISFLLACLLGLFVLMSVELEADLKRSTPRLHHLSDYVITLPYLDMDTLKFDPYVEPFSQELRDKLATIDGVESVYYQHGIVDDAILVQTITSDEIKNLLHYQWKLPEAAIPEQTASLFYRGSLSTRPEDPGYIFIPGVIGGYGEEELEFAQSALIEGNIDINRMATDPIVLLPKYLNSIDSFDVPYTKLGVGDKITLVESKVEFQGNRYSLTPREEYVFTVGGFVDPLPFPPVTPYGSGFVGIIHYSHLEKLQTNFAGIKAIYVDDKDGYDTSSTLQSIVESYGYTLTDNRGFEQSALQEQARSEMRLLYTVFGTIGFVFSLTMFYYFRAEMASRKREYAILSAVGMTPRQVISTIVTQFLITTLVGCVLGFIGAGLLFYNIDFGVSIFTKDQLIPWTNMGYAALVSLIAPLTVTVLSMLTLGRTTIRDIVQE